MAFINWGNAVKAASEMSDSRRGIEFRAADQVDGEAELQESVGKTRLADGLRETADDMRTHANRESWPSQN